jgi:hypothetical protein
MRRSCRGVALHNYATLVGSTTPQHCSGKASVRSSLCAEYVLAALFAAIALLFNPVLPAFALSAPGSFSSGASFRSSRRCFG